MLKRTVVVSFISTLCIILFDLTGYTQYDGKYDHNNDGEINDLDLFEFHQHWHSVDESISTQIPTSPFTSTPTVSISPTPTLPLTPSPTPSELPQEIIISLPGGITLSMIRIPSGIFDMGSLDDSSWSWCFSCEQPVHEVNIEYDFYMGKTEITQAQWQALMGSNPAHDYGVGDNYPVYYVSWEDCQDLVVALNQLGQGTFRLPSEAEWEYACRAGTTTRFYFGDSNDCGPGCNDCAAGVLPGNRSDYMWYCGINSPYGAKPAGQLIPNDFGLYDMHGNVDEWCEDDGHYDYTDAPADGTAWIDNPRGIYRVVRGGDWDYGVEYCRSSSRDIYFSPDRSEYFIGVRIVRTIDAILSVIPSTLDFGYSENRLTFDISKNIGSGILNWTVSESESWLECQSIQGGSDSDGTYGGTGEETVTVTVNRVGLIDGDYTTNVNIASNGRNSVVQVNMKVSNSGGPTITVDLPNLPAEAKPLTLVSIPAGSFNMGSVDDASWSWCYPCEQPVHPVNIEYDFYISQMEITQAQWQTVMWGVNPAHDYGVGDNYPVYYVSWSDCQNFILALNQLGQGTFRLPSEAEWEYACRAGTTTRFCFGDSNCLPEGCESCELDHFAWWCGNNESSDTKRHGSKPVGQLIPNNFGLYDMHGNVWEWCEDDYHDDYTNAPDDGTPWVDDPRQTYRVIRGGGWYDNTWYCRSASRDREYIRGYDVGVRIVREID